MECSRCQGFMVVDTCLNKEGFRYTVWIHEWRCLNCGEIFDATALANRKTCQSDIPPRRVSHVANESSSRFR